MRIPDALRNGLRAVWESLVDWFGEGVDGDQDMAFVYTVFLMLATAFILVVGAIAAAGILGVAAVGLAAGGIWLLPSRVRRGLWVTLFVIFYLVFKIGLLVLIGFVLWTLLRGGLGGPEAR